MPNLGRRIEALEKSTSAMRRARQASADRAMEKLSLEDLELLISAFGADREGRALTEGESAARRAYGATLEWQCRGDQLRPPTLVERIPDIGRIHQAIILALARRWSPEELQLAVSGSRAQQESRAPTDQELAAMQAVTSELERLCQRSGFHSEAEFASFRCSLEFAQGDNRW